MQISLAHGFGDGREESCGYARDAVSRLLQGESIDFTVLNQVDYDNYMGRKYYKSYSKYGKYGYYKKSIISGATKQRKNERIYGLSCALRLGKDASFSRLLHEETDGKERSFVKKCGVSVFCAKKTCESKDKVLN